MFIISQISIVLMALVSTFLPPSYRIIVFILYFIVIMGITFRRARTWSKMPPQKELGSLLFKEANATKIAMTDKELISELKKQVTASMSLLLLSFLVIILFPLYNSTIYPLTQLLFSTLFENEVLANFLTILVMYEFIFGILFLLRSLVMRKYKFSNIMLPQSFAVYRKGVVLNNRFFIEFSQNYCYEYNPKRRYVELRDKRSGMRIRLYTESSSTLNSRIAELGLANCSSLEEGEDAKNAS